ncbi:MAG TPA: hypothetical protein VGD60_10680 [Candidatus Acidoferrales bacterium]
MDKYVIHVSASKAASDFTSLLDHVLAGAEVVIEDNAQPLAVIQSVGPRPRTIAECIALLPEDSTATIDSDFAKDVEAAVDSHVEPLRPPAWD